MNTDLLSFVSSDPIDKIVQHNTITIVNDGATGQNYQRAKIVTATQPNNYHIKALARARWSIDGGANWQSLESRSNFTFTVTVPGPFSTTLSGLRAGVSVGCSNENVHFITANGYHGNVTISGGIATYTPVSQTFLIEYWLYEVE